jgi:uncharacterized DUF497 family protein
MVTIHKAKLILPIWYLVIVLDPLLGTTGYFSSLNRELSRCQLIFECKNWLEILIPGRQDKSERTTSPEIRSADLIVAPFACPRTPHVLRNGGAQPNFQFLSHGSLAIYALYAYTWPVTATFDPKKNAENLKKHGVSLAEGDGVLSDPLAVTIEDESAQGEQRFVTLGGNTFGALMVVVLDTS